MINEISSLINEYFVWLKNSIQLKEFGEWVEITTPYLDRYNDHLQIYARKTDDGYLLTDDGYVINDLENSGVDLSTQHRQKLLYMTLNGFGVKLSNGKIEVNATEKEFAHKKHNLIQAMLAINDMFYLARSSTRSTFYEDVSLWLDQNDIPYVPRINFTGKSGFNHSFDFVIAKTRYSHERVLQCINKPDQTNAERFIFSWEDTKFNRTVESKAYPILNDEFYKIDSSVSKAFENYNISPIYWTKINSSKELLAA